MVLTLIVSLQMASAAEARKAGVRGAIVDAADGRPLAARIYVQSSSGEWLFPSSTSPEGSALRYQKQNWVNTNAVEMHTTLSAHLFVIDLEPGAYTVSVERGKEYFPFTQAIEIKDQPVAVQFPLKRWINLAERGWYSGDTHVHRALDELPNLLSAEDVNVAFPLVYWVTKAFAPPARGDKNIAGDISADLIKVDATHVIYPRNTEYEIFTVDGKNHTLGAVFVLNHRTAFEQGAPPVGSIAARAHQEGALLDLDKHDWPWSMMLVPVMEVDLYELSNNHVWRTEFGFTKWNAQAPDYLGLPNEGWSGAERDWIEYGLRNYYTLLNCGFRLRPTAGTANGVHPVPLGFSRVYVHLPDGFSYDGWVRGLKEGRSFVTTGPMLFAKIDNQDAGHTFKSSAALPLELHLSGSVVSEMPLSRIEIVVNGDVQETLSLDNRRTKAGAFENTLKARLEFDASGWMAVRCFEGRAAGRVRFAHSGPFYVEVPGKPLRPRRQEVEFLIRRVQDQITRSGGVLPAAAMAEYQKALAIYQEIARTAR